jgi:glutathione synthase/RimK-type ligase-like ATP-grasp enzyme
VDALHVLAAHGVRIVNGPRALERTIDKSWAGAVLAGAGIPTPQTIVCERYEGAMHAFERLGEDVVVKPLFGAMGNGIVRIEDRDVAHRVFRALELERTVYYVQRTIAPVGRRDRGTADRDLEPVLPPSGLRVARADERSVRRRGLPAGEVR